MENHAYMQEYGKSLQVILDAAKGRLNPRAHGGQGVEYCAELAKAICFFDHEFNG